MAEAPGFLTTDWILAQFHRSPARATNLYCEFVRQGRGVDAWAELRGGILLGTDEFADKLKPFLSDYEALKEVPCRERLATRPSLDELFSDVNDKAERDRRIHAAVRAHEYTLQAVADYLRLHYSTIRMIAKRVAGRRRTPRVKFAPVARAQARNRSPRQGCEESGDASSFPQGIRPPAIPGRFRRGQRPRPMWQSARVTATDGAVHLAVGPAAGNRARDLAYCRPGTPTHQDRVSQIGLYAPPLRSAPRVARSAEPRGRGAPLARTCIRQHGYALTNVLPHVDNGGLGFGRCDRGDDEDWRHDRNLKLIRYIRAECIRSLEPPNTRSDRSGIRLFQRGRKRLRDRCPTREAGEAVDGKVGIVKNDGSAVDAAKPAQPAYSLSHRETEGIRHFLGCRSLTHVEDSTRQLALPKVSIGKAQLIFAKCQLGVRTVCHKRAASSLSHKPSSRHEFLNGSVRGGARHPEALRDRVLRRESVSGAKLLFDNEPLGQTDELVVQRNRCTFG